MKINFSQSVHSIDGKPFMENEKPLTLGTFCWTALLANYQDEQNLAGEEKFKRFNLASKLYGMDEVDLTAEDIAKIKACVGKFHGPAVVGPVYNALENSGGSITPIKKAAAAK